MRIAFLAVCHLYRVLEADLLSLMKFAVARMAIPDDLERGNLC